MNTPLNLATVGQIFDELYQRLVPCAVMNGGQYGLVGTAADMCVIAKSCLESALEWALEYGMPEDAAIVEQLREVDAKTKEICSVMDAVKSDFSAENEREEVKNRLDSIPINTQVEFASDSLSQMICHLYLFVETMGRLRAGGEDVLTEQERSTYAELEARFRDTIRRAAKGIK